MCVCLPPCPPQSFARFQQEDAHEFLVTALDAMERDIKRGYMLMGGSKVGPETCHWLHCPLLPMQEARA